MANDLIGTAHIEIHPNFKSFGPETKRAFADARRQIQSDVGKIEGDVKRGFMKVSQSATIQPKMKAFDTEIRKGFAGARHEVQQGVSHIESDVKTGFSRVEDTASSSIMNIGSRAKTSMMVAGTAIVGIGAVVATAGATMGIQTAAGLEQASIAFTQLLHSGAKAKEFISDLSDFAATTPFELPGLIDAARQLIGAGAAAKTVIPTLTAWGDATGALGVGQEAFERIMIAVTQSMNKGKVQAEELMQITEAGVPVYPLLAKALHKTVPELQELSSKGKLLAKDVFPALEAQMHKDYGGAMSKQALTLNGVWSTLMDTINLGLAKSLTPLIPMIKTGVSGAVVVFGAVLKKFSEGLEVTTTIVKNFYEAFKTGTVTSGGALGFVQAIGTAFGSLNKIVQNAFTKVRETISSGLGDVKLGNVSAQFIGWGTSIVGWIKTGLDTGDWAPLGRSITTGIGLGLDAAKNKATELSGKLIGYLNGLDWKKIGENTGSKLALALAAAGKAVGEIGKAMIGLFSKVDWFAVGKAVGAQTGKFVIGFLSTLFDGLITAIKEHPKDALVAALAIIPIGRVAGLMAKSLRAIPWVGRLLGPIAESLAGAGKFMEKIISPFVKLAAAIGRGLLQGFDKVFPTVRAGIQSKIGTIATGIGVYAIRFYEWGGRFVRGIGNGIIAGAELVGRSIGRVISLIVSPLAKAGAWITRAGGIAIRGYASGVLSAAKLVFEAVSFIGRQMLYPFTVAARAIGKLASATFRAAATAALGFVRIAIGGLRSVTLAFLAFAGNAVHAAAVAFGWVPGIGPKLKSADRKMAEFRKSVTDKFAAMGTSANGFQTKVNKLHGKNVSVNVSIAGQVFAAFDRAATGGDRSRGVRLAAGGTVTGGVAGKDSVDVKAMPGEEVVNTRAASKGKNRQLIKFINAVGDRVDIGGDPSMIRIGNPKLPFRDGGTIPARGGDGASIAPIQSFARGGTVESVANWVRAQAGKWYQWGATGPSTYDCSGYVGGAYGVATGRNPYQRFFTTANEAGFFRRGRGTFTIGVGNGHTTGNIGGLAFEAPHTGARLRLGAAARSVTSFPYVGYLPMLGSTFIPGGSGKGSAGPVYTAAQVRAVAGRYKRQILMSYARDLKVPVVNRDTGGPVPHGWAGHNTSGHTEWMGPGGATTVHLVVENHGVIADEMQAMDWLSRSLTRLRLRGKA